MAVLGYIRVFETPQEQCDPEVLAQVEPEEATFLPYSEMLNQDRSPLVSEIQFKEMRPRD